MCRYGQPGVEFYGEHADEACVRQIVFVHGQGRLVTLTEDNFLHLWEINGLNLEEKKSANLDGRLKKISVLCMAPTQEVLLLGTEGGNVYQLDMGAFAVSENIIYQDVVVKGAPEDFKVNPGPVEALINQPGEPNRVLIGYARGLIAVWDRAAGATVSAYGASQQLESVAWRGEGSQFISAHNDGSYVIWSADQGGSREPLEPPNTPYGPYPCKAITKIAWANNNGDSWTVFSGGMPRASYGDKYTVTVMKGEDKHIVFDVTSKVVDFLLIPKADATCDGGDPAALIILAEEELVTVDLGTDAWPVVGAPSLNAIHASAVTCLAHVDSPAPEVLASLRESAVRASSNADSWPVTGGKVEPSKEVTTDLLVSGHEDGSVKVWDCSSVSLIPLATVKTNKFFVGDDLDEPPTRETPLTPS